MRMRATQNFAYGTKLGESWVHGGTILEDDHPLVKAFSGFFEPVVEAPAPPPPPKRPGRRG